MSQRNGLEAVRIEAADGACAEIYAYGAHLTSWRPADAAEQMFLSPLAEFREGVSIRGGVPIIFPQFADLGALPKHGLLRTAVWDCVEQGRSADRARAVFRVRDNASTQALWPQAFAAELHVEVWANNLNMTFLARNTGAEPFSFTAALHSYIRVADIGQVSIQGLKGLDYVDKVLGESVTGPHRHPQKDDELRIAGEVDRVYLEARQPIVLNDGTRALEVRKTGFDDVVTWNPGPDLSTRLKDLGPDGYRTMVCIEAGAIGKPIVLQPATEWRGTQELKLLSS